MDKIKEIVEEGIKLSEKRTWLAKGYIELVDKINNQLSTIPDMSQAKISYIIREYNYSPNNYDTYKRVVRCNLVFEDDAYLEMILSKETPGEWERETISEPSIETIREFSGKLPEMFDFFLAEIKKSNEANQQTIDIIGNLLSKM